MYMVNNNNLITSINIASQISDIVPILMEPQAQRARQQNLPQMRGGMRTSRAAKPTTPSSVPTSYNMIDNFNKLYG